MSIKVIGLTGKARAGKDTVARIIHGHIIEHSDATAEFQDTWVVGLESFAAPIKSMIAMLLDFFAVGSIQQPETLQPFIDGDKKEEPLAVLNDVSPRTLMQTLGTDWGRNLIDPNIWLYSMVERIKMYQAAIDHGHAGAIVVATDTRFDNEAEVVIGAGGIIVNVVRDDAPEEVGETDHESELGIRPDLIEITIHNNGSLEDLVTKVKTKLADILPEIPPMPIEVEHDDEQTEASA